MATDRLRDALPDGEPLRYTGSLRHGGAVDLTDERLLVARPDDEAPISVEHGDVESVEFRDFDYFGGVLSVLLVGFGALTATSNPLPGIGLAAAGVVSLYVSYRKRDRAMVKTHSRPKPLVLYPADAGEFHDAFDRRLSDYREAADTEGESLESTKV